LRGDYSHVRFCFGENVWVSSLLNYMQIRIVSLAKRL
jgi:hypothetical protein